MNKILIIAGDPNSINSEIIFKSWKKLTPAVRKKIVLVGNYTLIFDQFRRLQIKINLKKLTNIDEKNSCPSGSKCKSTFNQNSVSMIAYDSCDDRAWTCQNPIY